MNTMTFSPHGPALTGRVLVRLASWPIALLAMVAHVVFGDSGFPEESLWSAGILAALTVLVCARIQPHVFPIIPIVVFRYYLSMGLPIFSMPRLHTAVLGRVPVSLRAMADAHLGSLLFLGSLLCTALCLAPLARRLRPWLMRTFDRPGEYKAEDTVAARWLASLSLASFAVPSLYSAADLPASFGHVVGLFASPEIALGLLFWDAYKTRTYSSKVICVVALVVRSMAGLSTGMLGNAVWPWIGAILLLWTLWGRFPLLLVSAITAVVLLLNPAKVMYRRLSWNQTHEVTVVERAENWVSAIGMVYSGVSEDAAEASSTAATGVATRMSTMLETMHMFDWVPNRIPHAGPGAYYSVPLFYVPTLLWPGRPNMTVEYNQKYATTFGIHLRSMTKVTTTTPPSVGDGYWRLGWFGVALEGVVYGLLAGLFQGLASPLSRSLTIIGLGFVMSIGGPEGAAVGQLAAFPKYIIVLAGVLLTAQWLPNVVTKVTGALSPIPTKRMMRPDARPAVGSSSAP